MVEQTELFQLPPPSWAVSGDCSVATMFAHRQLREMDKDLRVHARYLHASLRWVSHEPITNTTLRDRFGIDPKNAAAASRIIRDALEAGVIKPVDPSQGKRNARYTPHWA
ncbi:hypothetical protein SAMN05444336_1045 [Albimonas donghaensis]|uniref:Uncharacterized protein n=1 Tax=Albimonas donghaensis TaxID=356660 RepID=A0A1H2ZZU8_9RHOB|nr:hypothetical protein [Albimonas donghaensis]SDX22895.1 hypothetical protein SAMN05444336_1045 [Albimonas donghaensis]